MNHIRKAIKIVGGQIALAKACGVTQPSISNWVKTNRIPAERVLFIEKLTNGAVTRHELRPDLYPLE